MAFCVGHWTRPLFHSQGRKSIWQTSFSTSSLSCHLLFSYLFSSLLLSLALPLLLFSLVFLSSFISVWVYSPPSLSHSSCPEVQLQVHIGHYDPVERYSPPLRPHLSLSFSLSPASVWSLLVLRDKLLPSCLWRSLFIPLFFSPLSYFVTPFNLSLGATQLPLDPWFLPQTLALTSSPG